MYFVTAKSMFAMSAGLIGLLGMLAYTFIRLECKKKNKLQKQAVQSAQDYLSHAIAERSIIEVTLDTPATHPDIHDIRCPSFVGTCVEVKAQTVVLSVSPQAIDASWLKAGVQVFFQVKKHPSQRFCNFQSHILNIVPQKNENLVYLEIPNTISHEQRRLFVRLHPNLENMEPLDLWHGVLPPGSDTIKWLAFPRESFKLDDISVGGAKIEFKQDSAWKGISPGATLLLKLILPPVPRHQPLRQVFLIECKCVRVVQPTPNQLGHVGLGFSRWLNYDPVHKTKNWHTIEKELGMTPLGRWILQKQMEQHHAATNGENADHTPQTPAEFKL